MNIVIVGAKDRESAEDVADVGRLLELLEQRYTKFTVLTVMSHLGGIGRIVRNHCQGSVAGKGAREHRFPVVEADVRVYAHDLTREEMAVIYTARNATLYELGDLFFSFPHPHRRAVIDELTDTRAAGGGRPYRIFMPGDEITLDRLE